VHKNTKKLPIRFQ